MPLLCNLRHLEEKNLHLRAERSVDDLGVHGLDEMIDSSGPLTYDLEVQKLEQGVLVQGRLALTLDCECVRCLKAYRQDLQLDHWACHLALAGEEKAAVVNDCVDLTPYIREDIVLAFPQHPLCEPECKGLSILQNQQETGAGREQESASATWA